MFHEDNLTLMTGFKVQCHICIWFLDSRQKHKNVWVITVEMLYSVAVDSRTVQCAEMTQPS